MRAGAWNTLEVPVSYLPRLMRGKHVIGRATLLRDQEHRNKPLFPEISAGPLTLIAPLILPTTIIDFRMKKSRPVPLSSQHVRQPWLRRPALRISCNASSAIQRTSYAPVKHSCIAFEQEPLPIWNMCDQACAPEPLVALPEHDLPRRSRPVLASKSESRTHGV